MNARLIVRTDASRSVVFLLFAFLLIGNLLMGSRIIVAAEDDTSDESSGISDSESDASTSVVEESTSTSSSSSSSSSSCLQATKTLLDDGSEIAKFLEEAITKHSAAMESSMTDEEWSFGFPKEDTDAFKEACQWYNDLSGDSVTEAVIWKEVDTNLTLTCDMPQMKVTGKTVELFGIADCVANTDNCQALTMMDLAKPVWKDVGLECRATAEEETVEESTGDEKADGGKAATVEGETGEDGNGEEKEDDEKVDKDELPPTKEKNEPDTNGDAADTNDKNPKETAGKEEEEENENEDEDEEEEEEEEENTTEALTPGSNEDSDERLPFLTDEDMACMNATDDFVSKHKGLTSAIKTYESTKLSTFDDEKGAQIIGHKNEAANVMKTACELKKGHWAFVKNMGFTCVIKGMETIPVHVHNTGSCLAVVDDCLQMDTTKLLKVELHEMGYNCWEDDDNDGDNAAPASNDDSVGTEDSEASESSKNSNEEDDTSEAATENEPSEGEDEDKENAKDADEGNEQDSSDGLESEVSDTEDAMGLEESDQKCMDDTLALTIKHTNLEAAIEEFEASMDAQVSDISNLFIGFPDEKVAKLKSLCTDSAIGGYFAFIEEDEFVCDIGSVETKLKLKNLADCLADTTECKNMNILMLMENVWQSMGLRCKEKTKGDEEDSTSSTTDNTKQPDENDNDTSSGNGKDEDEDKDEDKDEDSSKPDDDNSLAKDLGLTESEIACMKNSTSFIDSSDNLANATLVYQKSVVMTDPTKLGYDAASASEMEKVCKEEGGLWSFIESEDVTCVINGRDRCINVYNFGNCIANSDDCQSMDTMVLVKGFFMEVLRFKCRPKCDKHNDTAGHPPSSSPPGKGDNLSSTQKNGGSSSTAFALPSFVVPALVVCGLVAVGFLVVWRVRSGRRREAVVRRTYEMTDVSDLGFMVFT